MCAACEWPVGASPDFELIAPRADVVYYLRFRDRVKIGTSANPRRRLTAIKHDELLAFERGDRTLERARHAQFAELRLERSEWFIFGPALQRHVETLAGSTSDPWRTYARFVKDCYLDRM